MPEDRKTLSVSPGAAPASDSLLQAARRTAVVAAVLAAILSTLMTAHYLQTRSADPLKSQALARLMLQLRDNPEDAALKEQIRALDLLARRAYFLNQWQIRTGSFLLFAFLLVFLASMKIIHSRRLALPDLGREPGGGSYWEEKLLARRYLLLLGTGLGLVAVALGLVSESELKKYGSLSARREPAGPPGATAGPDPVASPKQAASAFPGLEALQQNWPGFRGPDGNGVAYAAGVPAEWDGRSSKNILWKVPVPLPGKNSPVVWGSRLFLSGADKKSEVVFCFDRESGKILWQSELKDIPGAPAEPPRISEDTGYAAPTLAVDGRFVCAVFSTGNVGCFDMDGKRIWARNLGIPDNHYGHASSPLIFEDLLLVPFDQNSGGRLVALRVGDGSPAYEKRREVQISWASPILARTPARPELVLSANPLVAAYDPRTGEELWQVKCMSGEVGPSPAYADGMVFAVNEYARLAAIRLGAKAEMAWEYLEDLSSVSSLLATRDYVFNVASYGAVSCFQAKTGERHWIHDFPNGVYSSPVLAGGLVYMIDINGITHIFKADKTFQPVRSNELGEKTFTVPAFMPGRIYIRAESNLYGIGEKSS